MMMIMERMGVLDEIVENNEVGANCTVETSG